MKLLLILTSSILLLSSCTPLENDEIIILTKHCQENGMKAMLEHNIMLRPYAVTCYPITQ